GPTTSVNAMAIFICVAVMPGTPAGAGGHPRPPPATEPARLFAAAPPGLPVPPPGLFGLALAGPLVAPGAEPTSAPSAAAAAVPDEAEPPPSAASRVVVRPDPGTRNHTKRAKAMQAAIAALTRSP